MTPRDHLYEKALIPPVPEHNERITRQYLRTHIAAAIPLPSYNRSRNIRNGFSRTFQLDFREFTPDGTVNESTIRSNNTHKHSLYISMYKSYVERFDLLGWNHR